MSWTDLFERADAYRTDVETVREMLAARRNERAETEEGAKDA